MTPIEALRSQCDDFHCGVLGAATRFLHIKAIASPAV
jgi:hypothetical protein